MSSQFPRVDTDPSVFLAPPPQPDADPFASVGGKLGALLNGNGPLTSGIGNQVGKKMLLDDMDNAGNTLAGDPWNWDEAPKTKEFDKAFHESGAAAKPKDPRLKDKAEGKDGAGAKDQADGKPQADGGVDGKSTLRELLDKENKGAERKPNAFDPKPYDKDAYYAKNPQQLDLGGLTDWANQKGYEQKLRDKEKEAAGKAGTEGGGAHAPKNDKPARDQDVKNRFLETEGKRTGLSTESVLGNYVPQMRDGPLDTTQVDRKSSFKGHEDVDRLNGGDGYSQTNAGLWKDDEAAKRGATTTVGAGARASIVNVFDAGGSGTATLGASGLAGVESSSGFKYKFKALDTNVNIGTENRAGEFGEATLSYKPVAFEPKIFGAPIDLSPELGAAGRVFNGGELGSSFKGGWRFVPDPMSGKMAPEIGAEVKGSAFIGGKAEGDLSVGVAGIGSVGATAGAMYGVGAEGKAALGLNKGDDGKTRLKGELKIGASLGLGVSLGAKFDINVDGLITFGANLIKANKAFVNKVGEGVQTATRAVEGVFNRAAGALTGAATNAFRAAREGIDTAAAAVKNAANTAVEGVKNTADKVADGVKDVANKVADGVKDVANTVVDGVKDVGKKVKNFFKKLF